VELDAGVGETPIGPNLAEALTSAGLWDEALETIEEALGQDPAPEGRAYWLQRAAELASQLRARPLLQQISRAARRARVGIAGTSPADPAAPFGLVPYQRVTTSCRSVITR